MRVLNATVTAGGGHLAAAAALQEAWRTLRPEDTIEQVDLVKFFSPLHRKIHADGYVQIVTHAPEIWGLMFDKTDRPEVARRLNKLKHIFPSNSRARFARCVKDFQPDVILCTHYLPLETIGLMRKKELAARTRSRRSSLGKSRGAASATAAQTATPAPSRPLAVSIITDFEAHALWMDPCVDLYCVAAQETKARLLARGASEKNIVVTGIPISAKFSAPIDAQAVRKTMGLRDDLPVLLVPSGGFGMGPVGKIVAALDQVERPFQIIVVTGRNAELRQQLAAQDRRHPTRVLGYATNMHELMAISDLILTKPGGLTSSEALAMGRPLFILNPIPGQEAANSDFLLERGAATKVNRVEDLPFRVEQLLGSRKLSEMARAAKALGHPHAAQDVCREVLRRFGPKPEG